MADTVSLVLLFGLVVIVVFLLSNLRSLKKTVSQMDVNVKQASNDEVVFRQGLIARMDTYERTVIKPVETLGDVVTSLQQTMGTAVTGLQQNVGTVVKGLQESITSVSVQAEKIANFSQKYEESEKLTRAIHDSLIGSYSKGKAGEEALKRMMVDLMKLGLIESNVPLGRGVVEYALKFKDGKRLAIDSKVVSPTEVSALFDEKLAPDERSRMTKEIVGKVRDKISQVEKYIDPPKTLPMAVMALPDPIMERITELIPEAVKRNIILVGYSAVPQLIPYFTRIYSDYAINDDVSKLKEKLSKANQEISKLNEGFFFNHFEKPLGTISKAVKTVSISLIGLSGVLNSESDESRKDTLESFPTEKEIPITASR